MQTPIFKTQTSQGIQKWVQTNQFLVPPTSDFFKLLFWYQKLSKKLDVLLIFEILSQEMCIIKTSSEKIDFGTSRICSKILKTKLFFHALLLKHLKSGKMGPFIDFPIFVPIYVHKKDQF